MIEYIHYNYVYDNADFTLFNDFIKPQYWRRLFVKLSLLGGSNSSSVYDLCTHSTYMFEFQLYARVIQVNLTVTLHSLDEHSSTLHTKT